MTSVVGSNFSIRIASMSWTRAQRRKQRLNIVIVHFDSSSSHLAISCDKSVSTAWSQIPCYVCYFIQGCMFFISVCVKQLSWLPHGSIVFAMLRQRTPHPIGIRTVSVLPPAESFWTYRPPDMSKYIPGGRPFALKIVLQVARSVQVCVRMRGREILK